MYAHIFKDDCIIIHKEGKQYRVSKAKEGFYNAVTSCLKKGDTKGLDKLLDKGTHIKDKSDGAFSVKDGKVIVHTKELSGDSSEVELNNTLTNRIIKMLEDGDEFVKPIIAFLKNLSENPSRTAVNELYSFLDCNELPITEDGHFLAYKVVRNDYKDVHSNTMDNSPGKVVSMPRISVDDNRHNTCSTGLHFCSISYVPSFHQQGHKIVTLKINPRDVVSIPSDYNNAKGRCCRYEVINDITENVMGKGSGDDLKAKPKDVLSNAVVSVDNGTVSFTFKYE